MEDQVAFTFIQPIFDVGGHVPTLKKCLRQDQAALFVGFHLGHVSI
jgi:hypothetical protein